MASERGARACAPAKVRSDSESYGGDTLGTRLRLSRECLGHEGSHYEAFVKR